MPNPFEEVIQNLVRGVLSVSPAASPAQTPLPSSLTGQRGWGSGVNPPLSTWPDIQQAVAAGALKGNLQAMPLDYRSPLACGVPGMNAPGKPMPSLMNNVPRPQPVAHPALAPVPGAAGLGGMAGPPMPPLGNAPINRQDYYVAPPPALPGSFNAPQPLGKSSGAIGVNFNPAPGQGATGIGNSGGAFPGFSKAPPGDPSNLQQHLGAAPPARGINVSDWQEQEELPRGVSIDPHRLAFQETGRAQDSENRPDIQALANNPIVAKGIAKAWRDSDPWRQNVPVETARVTYPHEQGAWARQNYKGDIWTEPMPPGDENSIASSPPNHFMDWLLGNRTIGAIHTHSIGSNPQGPSPADKDVKSGLPEIIQTPTGQYYLGAPVPSRPEEPLWHKAWRGLGGR